MAHSAKLSALTDELVQSLLAFDPATNRQAYRHAKDVASRGLKGHQYARTNQFHVDAALQGLNEKFRIKGRDDLADALQSRIQKLQNTTSKFRPDFLSLLLLLADRPLENTNVDALGLLRPPSPPPPLTWSRIIEDDPYSDEEMWKDIDYGVNSSDDEQTASAQIRPKLSHPTSVDEDDVHDISSCLEVPNKGLIKEIISSQFWTRESNDKASQVELSELQMIRESLFMLQGYSTNMFPRNGQDHPYVDARHVLTHGMSPTIHHLLSNLVSIGTDVLRLRQWFLKSSSTPLLQSFEAAVRKRLLQYDQSLSMLQQQYQSDGPLTISLLDVHDQVQRLSHPILRLAQIVISFEKSTPTNPFHHLEALYDEITLSQLILEEDVFCYMSDIFFECLQTYLRPIRQWMEHGTLGDEHDAFFVFSNDACSEAESLWHDRFVLRRDAEKHVLAPKFLHMSAKQIFDTGKSIVFLAELGIDHSSSASLSANNLETHQVLGASRGIPISPFPELLEQAFDKWIGTKYTGASEALRQHLFKSDQLMQVLGAIECIYLGKNGAIFENFAVALFERLAAGRKGWNDRYILTELAQSTFGQILSADFAERLVVRTRKFDSNQILVGGLCTISLEFSLSWSIRNIIQPTCMLVYQTVWSFLLEVYRAKHLLQSINVAHDRGKIGTVTELQTAAKLRHRLIWFTDTLRSYLTETVILTTMQDMHDRMVEAQNVDELALVHQDHVNKLQTRALLSQDVKVIFDAITEMLKLCSKFARTMSLRGSSVETTARRNRKKGTKNNAHGPLDNASEHDQKTETTTRTAQAMSPNLATTTSEILREYERLLPFIIAGLKSVGRAGAEPMWEQLAEQLQWNSKKDPI
ncbi:hypothetical protein ACN47E_009692 [Coniothyrium glycines]